MLRPLQEIFGAEDYPDLIVGLGVPDDAAVWRLDDTRALVVTTDFFPPVVDDARSFGAIAAANALSDLYAMGARPLLALNIAAFPASLPLDLLAEIMRAGAEKVREAGAVVAGGHTVQDDEPKYGLVAVGTCSLEHLMTKDQARPGDVLVLTKPLGTGVITTALKRGATDPEDVEEAVGWMTQLNAQAAECAIAFSVRAATDVTGYSLLGHGLEMAQSSNVALRLHLPSIPFMSSARRYAEGGFFPGGTAENQLHFGPDVIFSPSIDEYDQMLLFDAQTSGGLLLSVPEPNLSAFMVEAADKGVSAWAIGVVEEGEGIRVLDTAFRT